MRSSSAIWVAAVALWTTAANGQPSPPSQPSQPAQPTQALKGHIVKVFVGPSGEKAIVLYLDLDASGTKQALVKLEGVVDSPLNDLEDVTRVKVTGGKIAHIGKVIREFNAIDTGIFLCGPIMFDALEVSQAKGDDSISGAMNVLAGWGKAHAFDIKSRVWVDVDDPAAFRKAEELLEDGRL